MGARFVQGRDSDFNYDLVDSDETWDTEEDQEALDDYVEQEKPQWAVDVSKLQGETGVQDY